MSGATTISRVSDPNRMMVEKEIKVIGIVNEVKQTKTGEQIIEIEDETGRLTVMLGKGRQRRHRFDLERRDHRNNRETGPPGRVL